MSRGGIGFEGIGLQQATFKAGAGIKALVAAANRDAVVGLPVVISAAQTVDLGVSGATVFGFIDVYENDGHVGVSFRGFVTDVPIGAVAPTVGKIAATDGAGAVISSAETAKLRCPVVVEVDATAETCTVFLG
ncbi:hypothetical protein [Tissierella sp.]|uniref:hypothetical protein n=1 Tax=Tissierella sp. TaxID=41274 RepID=UPI0028630B2A|nr:hypothetical protein [Tissierella sp.]MDR7856088.1 hypothetical protein [Tissierella sp.]